MSINLTKGSRINLKKEAPGLKNVKLGLGWNIGNADSFDLDASVLMLNEDGKLRKPADYIFYNNKNSDCGSVVHNGDNLTGEGEGDDETVSIVLKDVPIEVQNLTAAVTIYNADSKNQNFGQVNNAFIRVVDNDTNVEIARYDLTEDYSSEKAVLFGELYRHAGEWKFKATGEGFDGTTARFE